MYAYAFFSYERDWDRGCFKPLSSRRNARMAVRG